MIKVRTKGDLSKTYRFLERAKEIFHSGDLDKYGRAGVAALSSATPIDTGLTSESWYYKIANTKNRLELIFCNSNIQNGVPIAVIIQYGHGTGSGVYVEGIDYINPAIQPIFNSMRDDIWKEVTKK